MGRLTRQANLRDEPDFLGLTEEQAIRLAEVRGLQLPLLCDDGSHIQPNIDTGRVTAELDGGVIVYAQRSSKTVALLLVFVTVFK